MTNTPQCPSGYEIAGDECVIPAAPAAPAAPAPATTPSTPATGSSAGTANTGTGTTTTSSSTCTEPHTHLDPIAKECVSDDQVPAVGVKCPSGSHSIGFHDDGITPFCTLDNPPTPTQTTTGTGTTTTSTPTSSSGGGTGGTTTNSGGTTNTTKTPMNTGTAGTGGTTGTGGSTTTTPSTPTTQTCPGNARDANGICLKSPTSPSDVTLPYNPNVGCPSGYHLHTNIDTKIDECSKNGNNPVDTACEVRYQVRRYLLRLSGRFCRDA